MSEPALACCTPLTGTPMSAEQAEQVAPLLKALADPVRLRLVSLIAASTGGEACVCDLDDAFDLTQATISHHLKVLHSAGLLDRDKRGVWVYYAVRPGRAGRGGQPVRHRRPRPGVSDPVRETGRTDVVDDAPVLQKLSTLDRFLPVWIIAAMALGLALGRLIPGLDDALSAVKVGTVSLPIAIGLLLMMYPVLAKVRYTELDRVTGDRRLLGARWC